MPVVNAQIASELDRIADLLEIEQANPFRVRAYRRAARVVTALPRNVVDMLAAGEDLDDLPGIGPDLAGKIATLAAGGELPLLAELSREVPPGVAALLAVPGLGPKRVHLLHDVLGIDGIPALTAAAKSGRLRDVPGIGPGIEATVLRALAQGEVGPPRTRLATAEQVVLPLLRYLRSADGVTQVEVAGSFRRRRDTVGDLDIVVAAEASDAVMRKFVSYDNVESVVEQGPTRATVRLRGGLQVDLRVVPAASFGTALCYFTGSKPHNIALRQIAIDRGWKLNEYGLFKGTRRIAGASEDGLYRHLGLAPVPPELREDSGEIAAARQGTLPKLISLADIRGDLHLHTDASDGRDSLRAMADAARERGYLYAAITEHSRRMTVAHGLDAKRLGSQIEAIARLNAELSGFTLLSGIEVDILEDGALDLPDDLLRRLDVVVGAIHSHFDLPMAKQTERILRAMDHPAFNILAHPSGRLINERPPCAIDMERVMREAAAHGCCLEVNAQPDRMDLTDQHCRLAHEVGVKLVISTDAHATDELDFMRFGVDQARRGWLQATDVINSFSLVSLQKLLRRK